MNTDSNLKGIMCMMGGMCIMMFCGCFYLWANISVYVLSYLYKFNPDVNHNAIFYVDTALVLLNVAGYQIGSYLLNVRKINPKVIVTLGMSISLGGIILSSYSESLWGFMFCYGFFSGIGSGMMYMIPLVCCWEYFPSKKGFVTGFIVGSYGVGSFIFSQISTRYINPENLDADIYINDDLSYYKEEVANRVPGCLRLMVMIWACQVTLGILLISRPG